MNIELIVSKKEKICDSIFSFTFKDKNGKKLKKAKAGQFMSFNLNTGNANIDDKMMIYTLSNKPNEDEYRISVKKLTGTSRSVLICDNLNVSDTIIANEPDGSFTINAEEDESIILLAGGIGVTPLLAMLYDEANKRKHLTFVNAMQNSSMHPFKDEIASICSKNSFKNVSFYSNPLDTDIEGSNYNVKGFITKEWLENNVPLNGYFYLCGPPVFMDILKKGLIELGVNEDRINFEKFA